MLIIYVIMLINIVPERNEKFFERYFSISISGNYLFLACLRLEANCELNYTPFGLIGAFAPI